MNKHWSGKFEHVPDCIDDVHNIEQGEHVRFKCKKCGGETFHVYAVYCHYETYVECTTCGICNPSDSDADDDDSTVIHTG